MHNNIIKIKQGSVYFTKVFLVLVFFIIATGILLGNAESAKAETFTMGYGTFTVSTDASSYAPGQAMTISASVQAKMPFITGPFSIMYQFDGGSWNLITWGGYAGVYAPLGSPAYTSLITSAPASPGNHSVNVLLSDSLFANTYSLSGGINVVAPPPPVGTINVTSNIPGASWTITGPETITGSGVSQSNTNKPTGTYTVTWNPVANYTTPASQSFTLTSGGTITFSGNYVAIPLPDLTAGTVTHPVVALGVPVTFSSTITNSGTLATGGSPEGTMTTYTGVAGSGAGASPRAIAFDGTNMWTANSSGGYSLNTVTKISPDGLMTIYPGVGADPQDIAFDGTNMWTANQYGNTVTKISPAGLMTTYPGVGAGSRGIAFDGTNMWTANVDASNSVTKVSPSGVMTTYTGAGTAVGSFGIAFDGTNMWTVNYSDYSVTKISPAGLMTTYTATGAGPQRIAFDGTNMWTVNYYSKSVTKISPAGLMTTYTGIPAINIAFDGTNMWTSNIASNSVTKVSPSGVMTTYTGTGLGPVDIAFDGTNMWTVNSWSDSVTKIGTSGSFHSFFRIATDTANPATYKDLFAVITPTLTQGASTAITRSYTFTTPGTYYVQACADKFNSTGTGTITESDENNNCSAWQSITIASSTLKVCPNPCNFSVPPFNGVTFSSIPTTLYACYGLATDCNGGDTNVIGTWSATNTPNDAINLSTNSGSSVNVSGNYSGSGTVMENITLSYLTATPVTAIASVSCTPLACNDPSITSQRTSYCPTETRTFDNSCTGTLDCPGTRNCDFNWKEIAP